MKKSRKIEKNEIPDWFNIKKYKNAHNLTPMEWHYQLEYRYVVYLMLKEGEGIPLLGRLEREGILPLHESISDNLAFLKERHKSMPYNQYSVFSLPMTWVFMLHEELTDDPKAKKIYEASDYYKDDKKQKYPDIQENDENISLDIYQMPDTTIDMDTFLAHIVVDLDASNEQLLSDFERWLCEFRKITKYNARDNHEKNYTEAQFRSWAMNRVLPFIDLDLWAKCQNVTISNHVLGNTIFPDMYDIDTTEKIVRTTRPLAKRLMTRETVNKLERQAMAYGLSK